MAKNFNVGGVPLNPKKVNKPFLREMYKAARGTDVKEGKEAALEAIEQMGKTGEMSAESFKDLDSYRKSVHSEYRADNARVFDFALDDADWTAINAISERANDLMAVIGDCGDEYR